VKFEAFGYPSLEGDGDTLTNDLIPLVPGNADPAAT
jgi:hypothetical protein